MDDPKKRQMKDDDDDLRGQIAALQATVKMLAEQKSGGQMDESRLEAMFTRVGTMIAEAQERAANPSNKIHPGISVYSYPEGDVKRPRPDFKCEMYWLGYPAGLDNTTAEEMELMNQAEPGDYNFRRTDGGLEKFVVTAHRDAGGKPTRLLFSIPDYSNRAAWPDNPTILRQALRIKSPQELELEKLRAEVEALRSVHA